MTNKYRIYFAFPTASLEVESPFTQEMRDLINECYLSLEEGRTVKHPLFLDRLVQTIEKITT